jgi:hypothetical protein
VIKKDAAEESGLDIISVLKTQQWETPWEVLEYVRGRWSIEFDACASPLNAIVPRYATAAESFLGRTDLLRKTIFCNPPYAMRSLDNSSTDARRCAAIGPFIRKLVDGDVCVRRCTAIAFLPCLAHADWYRAYVDPPAVSGGRRPHERHLFTSLFKWNNPFEPKPPANPYNYPFVLCVWRPGPEPTVTDVVVTSLVSPPRDHQSRSLHLRRCQKCGRVRVLPRHMTPARISPHTFACEQLGDPQYAACSAREYLMHASN